MRLELKRMVPTAFFEEQPDYIVSWMNVMRRAWVESGGHGYSTRIRFLRGAFMDDMLEVTFLEDGK